MLNQRKLCLRHFRFKLGHLRNSNHLMNVTVIVWLRMQWCSDLPIIQNKTFLYKLCHQQTCNLNFKYPERVFGDGDNTRWRACKHSRFFNIPMVALHAWKWQGAPPFIPTTGHAVTRYIVTVGLVICSKVHTPDGFGLPTGMVADGLLYWHQL